MAIREDPPPSVPEWTLTYGDLMSLLLTFFVLLAAMSEIRKDDRFSSVASALHERFGGTDEHLSRPMSIGERNEALALAFARDNESRALLLQGPHPILTDEPLQLEYQEQPDSTALPRELVEQLRSSEPRWRSQPIDLEIVAFVPEVEFKTDPGDLWTNAWRRSRRVAQYLLADLQWPANRLRIAVQRASAEQIVSYDPVVASHATRLEIRCLPRIPDTTVVADSSGLPPP